LSADGWSDNPSWSMFRAIGAAQWTRPFVGHSIRIMIHSIPLRIFTLPEG
jgi:hypothetical protein